MKIVRAMASLSLLGGCTVSLPTAPVGQTVKASPDGGMMLNGTAPVCVTRPENHGIMNVTPLTVEYVDAGNSITLIGGTGVCSWLGEGRVTVILRSQGPDASTLATSQIEVKAGSVTQLGICLVEEADESVGWALLINSPTCKGSI